MKISEMKKGPEKIKFNTRPKNDGTDGASILAEWWKADDERQMASQLCGTAAYLKTNQTYRLRQLAVSIRLYCGLNVYSYAGSNVSKMDRTKTLPDDKPTFNLVESCTDTLVSRLTQNQPEPKFLTDGADYKQRHLAQSLNQFILGEFYQCKVYEKAAKMLRDGCITGTGALKIYRGPDNKVAVDRVMVTDLYVDDNDSLNGDPQQMYQFKLMDRGRLMANNPKAMGVIAMAPQSYPDNAPDSGRTTADQILLIEAWKLPSGPDPEADGYVPGKHVIACQAGIIFEEEWKRPKFPFVFFKYSDPFLGFWGQGLGQRLFGTQMSLNRIMYTIARAITLVGVPKYFIEAGSKVSKAYINNEIGTIVPYSGVMPVLQTHESNAADMYQERDKLIDYGFRQEGISNMQATGAKPKGLDSGEAIRSYDDVNSDRFAETARKYENVFVELAYHITDVAMEIADETGKYQTVYPNKDGTKEINLPQMKFLKNPFVIKCFTESSLPRTPGGRIATVTEQVQAGMLSLKEGRRLLKFPDLEENAKLDNASEERIFQCLDKIVEDGEYTMPDPYMDLETATDLTVKYINLYLAANLEEEKADLLRKFFIQVQAVKQAGMPPPMPAPAPPASPMPAPTSPLVPNGNTPPLAA